jgi:transposase-like protein
MQCRDVAVEVGVSAQTISNWRRDYDFHREVQDAQHEMLRHTRDQIRGLVGDALSEIRKLMIESKSESVRLRASLAVLQGTGILGHRPQNARVWNTIDQL